MNGVNIYRINPKYITAAIIVENKRVHETPLIEIEPIYLASRSREERVARGEVVSQGTTEAGNTSPIVKTALGMQLDCAIILEVYGLCPIVRKTLSKVISATLLELKNIERLTYNKVDIFSV